MTQVSAFLNGEGDAWLRRNTKRLGSTGNDLVLHGLDKLVGVPRSGNYLEIGCSNGWRLKEIKKRYNANLVYGIDPSDAAIKEAKKLGIEALRGCATELPWRDGIFDVVIYGFCLYLIDRKDLFRAVMEGDRVLKDGGIIIVYDFDAHYPHKKPYKHKDGIWSYHQDYAKLFTANPAYSHLFSVSDQTTNATILKKSIERGWPEECE